MLSSTATRGWNVSTVSSWKLDTSTTQKPPASAAGVPTATASGSPRLPPTKVGRPLARVISPTSVVVVDLPFVPVMATIVAEMKRDASSSSPVISTPAARAAASSGISGTPGDSTIRSAPRKLSRLCPPSSSTMSGGSWARPAESSAPALVGHGDARAARRAELGRRDPGAPETDDEHALVRELRQAGSTGS